MELLMLPSKTDQVIDYLKVAMRSQKLKPGDKLMSIRKLAETFSVSPRLVVNALEILEQERLIWREHGRGVFVRSCSSNANIEVCLLAWDTDSYNPYFNNLMRISYSPYLQTGFNFTVRTVSFSCETTINHFAHELQKFEKMCHADCLLLNAPTLSAAKIKTCLKIKTPILFIGDFTHGLDPDIPFNQITGDNVVSGENCVKKLVEQEKTTEFVMYTPSLEHYFCRKFYEGVKNAAGALNLKMHLIEMPKAFYLHFDPQQQNKIFMQKTQEAGVTDFHNIPAIYGGIPSDFLKEQIKLGKACRNIYYHVNSEKYILEFYNNIFNEIKRITKAPNETKKIISKEDLSDCILKKL